MEKLGMSPVGRVLSGEKIMVSLVKGPKGIPPLMHHHEAEQIVVFFREDEMHYEECAAQNSWRRRNWRRCQTPPTAARFSKMPNILKFVAPHV